MTNPETNSQLARKMRKRWLLMGLVVLVGLYLGLDVFRGKMLGALVGTTVDPRSALGSYVRSVSMEPVLLTLKGSVVQREKHKKAGIETPRVSFAVPQAYLNVVRTEDEGWFGSNVTSLALQVSSENFQPYRIEFPHMRKEVLEQLDIKLVKRSETRPPDKLRRSGPSENELVFPDRESSRRYDAEMLRRGFTYINTGIGTNAEVDESERFRKTLFPLFGQVAGISPECREQLAVMDAPVTGEASPPQACVQQMKEGRQRRGYGHPAPVIYDKQTGRVIIADGCTMSPGPYPNSVRFDQAPKTIPPAPENGGGVSVTRACLSSGNVGRGAFAVVQYGDDGKLVAGIECLGERFYDCHAHFYWRDIWKVGLVVDKRYLARIPEFIEKAKALYDRFEAAAREQSRGDQ